MSHVLTVKIPTLLLERLEQTAQAKGRSKGALVREALELLLVEPLAKRERIESITRALLRKKKPRIQKVDWQGIYRKARQGPPVSPEEEVRRGRRRGL